MTSCPGIRLTKDGIPSDFSDLIPHIRKRDRMAIRIAFTLASITRLIRCEGPVDLDSITKGPSTKVNLTKWRKLIGSFVEHYGLSFNLEKPKHGVRLSSGPNGHAMLTAHLDAKTLSESQIKDLLSMHPGNPGDLDDLSDIRGSYHQPLSLMPRPVEGDKAKPPVTRRLSAIIDKEGKMRVIALFDYWSQLALKGYHEAANNCLRRLPADCTFDQHKVVKLIRYDGEVKASVDLSTATDRFPAVIQWLLMEKLVGPEGAAA